MLTEIRLSASGLSLLGRLVLPEGESLNTLFDELAAFEEQLKPYAYELEELGL